MGLLVGDTSQGPAFVAENTGTVKRVNALIVTATTTTLVAAVAGKAIMVLAVAVHASTEAQTVFFADDAGTPIQLWGGTGALLNLSNAAANGPPSLVLPWNPGGWFQTTVGEGLTIVNTGTTPDLNVLVTYAEVG